MEATTISAADGRAAPEESWSGRDGGVRAALAIRHRALIEPTFVRGEDVPLLANEVARGGRSMLALTGEDLLEEWLADGRTLDRTYRPAQHRVERSERALRQARAVFDRPARRLTSRTWRRCASRSVRSMKTLHAAICGRSNVPDLRIEPVLIAGTVEAAILAQRRRVHDRYRRLGLHDRRARPRRARRDHDQRPRPAGVHVDERATSHDLSQQYPTTIRAILATTASPIRLHRNEGALPPPEFVLEALRTIDAETLRTYPTALQRDVIAQLAARFGRNPERSRARQRRRRNSRYLRPHRARSGRCRIDR